MKQFWFKGMRPNVNVEAQPQKAQPQDSSGGDIQARRARLESERMTRRQALKKMGVMTGVAVLGLVTADDLARLAASALKEQKATRAIGDAIGRDFYKAGVAFADDMPNPYGDDNVPLPENETDIKTCLKRARWALRYCQWQAQEAFNNDGNQAARDSHLFGCNRDYNIRISRCHGNVR